MGGRARRLLRIFITRQISHTHHFLIKEIPVNAVISAYPDTTRHYYHGNNSNLLIVFYVQIMPDDFVMQLHRF